MSRSTSEDLRVRKFEFTHGNHRNFKIREKRALLGALSEIQLRVAAMSHMVLPLSS
jgi:hypothetical protein